MNPSLERALTIQSTWAALPLFPVGELADAAPLNPFIDEVRAFVDHPLCSDEKEYACLCADFTQGLQRHAEFQGPRAARLFAIGSRHWLMGQDPQKPHSNSGLLMSGRFWKSYSAECIRTFAPDRSLDWRSHVAAVSGFTKSLIKATWGNANTEYYCQGAEKGDEREVVMDSLGMLSLSPAAGGALVFHEFMHAIKESGDTFVRMFESARKGGYKGTQGELHPFFNSYEDIAVNVAAGSVLVDGMADVRELYQGVFLVNAYHLKQNYSLDSEFWVCAMARALGEKNLPFTPSAEVQALLLKHQGALDDLTCERSLPISKAGLIRREICTNAAKLAPFSRYRGEAEARLFFKLEDLSGQKAAPQTLGNPPNFPAPDKSETRTPGPSPAPGNQGTQKQEAASQQPAQNSKSQPKTAPQKQNDQGPGNPGVPAGSGSQEQKPGTQGKDPGAQQQGPAQQGKEPGNPGGTLGSEPQEQKPGTQGKDPGAQQQGPAHQGGQPDAGANAEPAGPDFSGLGEVGGDFNLKEPLLGGRAPGAKASADPDGKLKALEKRVPRSGATREDLLQDGILGYGTPVDTSALREIQREFAPVILRGKRLFQSIRENAERTVSHRAKLVEEGDTLSLAGMAMRQSDPEHTLIFENPAQAIAVNHARFGMILDMSGSTRSGDRFKRLVEMAAVSALAIEDAGYQTALGLFSTQGLLLYHAEYPKNEKMRRLGGLVKLVRHSLDLEEGAASVGLTGRLGFMGGTESEKAVGTFVEAITKTQSRKPGHFHGLIFTDGGLTQDRLSELIDANPKLTWSVLCEGSVPPKAEDFFGKENTHAVELDGDFIKTIFGAFSQSIKKFGSFGSASKIRRHYQDTLRDARRMPPEKAINVIK